MMTRLKDAAAELDSGWDDALPEGFGPSLRAESGMRPARGAGHLPAVPRSPSLPQELRGAAPLRVASDEDDPVIEIRLEEADPDLGHLADE
jgi:hypothetical protein